MHRVYGWNPFTKEKIPEKKNLNLADRTPYLIIILLKKGGHLSLT